MESVTCNICGSSAAKMFRQARDYSHGQPGEFSFVRCQQCGLVYLNPRPEAEELAQYYPENYKEFAQDIKADPSWFLRVNRQYGLDKRCKSVWRRKAGGRLLDLGCATGIFLDRVRQKGQWEVLGIDINEKAARYAREHFGLTVFVGDLSQSDLPDDFFDVITLWNVIEHVPDPVGTLRQLGRILKPGGLLVLGTPNVDSFDARLFGNYWALLEVPRHLYLFSPGTLSAALSAVGLQTAEVKCFWGEWFGFATSLQYMIAERLGITSANGYFFESHLESQWLRVLVWPYLYLVDRLARGSTMTLFATKPAR